MKIFPKCFDGNWHFFFRALILGCVYTKLFQSRSFVKMSMNVFHCWDIRVHMWNFIRNQIALLSGHFLAIYSFYLFCLFLMFPSLSGGYGGQLFPLSIRFAVPVFLMGVRIAIFIIWSECRKGFGDCFSSLRPSADWVLISSVVWKIRVQNVEESAWANGNSISNLSPGHSTHTSQVSVFCRSGRFNIVREKFGVVFILHSREKVNQRRQKEEEREAKNRKGKEERGSLCSNLWKHWTNRVLPVFHKLKPNSRSWIEVFFHMLLFTLEWSMFDVRLISNLLEPRSNVSVIVSDWMRFEVGFSMTVFKVWEIWIRKPNPHCQIQDPWIGYLSSKKEFEKMNSDLLDSLGWYVKPNIYIYIYI